MYKITNRPLGTNEKVFWVLDQKTTTQFAVVAEIDGNLIDSAWREALDIVQGRHPNLWVQISGNDYSTAHLNHVDNCRIPLRVVYTKSGDNWNGVLEAELAEPLDVTIAPLAKAVLIQQRGKSVFLFISNHSIGDGMSVALFIRDILTVLSGNTIGNLFPVSSLDEHVGISLMEPGEEVTGFDQAKNNLLPRTNVTVERLKLSGTLTKKLIERAKTEKTTVHGALTSAIVLALQTKSNPFVQEKPVRILHPLSARTTLSLGEDYGLLINIVTLPYLPSPQQRFWDFARETRQGIASTQTSDWIKADITATTGLFSNGLAINMVEDALHQGTAHEVMLTNLGQLSFASDFGNLELKSIWGPMVLTPHTLAQTVGVATFNGELTLTVTGLAPSQFLLETVEQIIEKSCGMPEDLQLAEF
jgi:putative cofactor-binding repeat protein